MHIFNKIKWFFYDLNVKLFGRKRKKIKSLSSKNKSQTIFLITLLAFPLIQFAVFYFGVNFNSILLAFQKYENGSYIFAGFENFSKVFDNIFVNASLVTAIKNSTIQFLLGLIIGMPIQIMVAYAVYKKVPFSGFLKIMLFLPQMISAMVFVNCAEYLLKYGLPQIFPSLTNVNLLDTSTQSSFTTVLIFGFWMTFAGGLVVYLGAMSSIPQEIMEYGELERLSSIKELWYIVVPMIFPTITTYVVVAFAGFFTNQGFFFSFFGGDAGAESTYYDTLGYVFFVKVAGDGKGTQSTLQYYPYAAASGLLFTILCTPLTVGVKTLLEKFGPKEE